MSWRDYETDITHVLRAQLGVDEGTIVYDASVRGVISGELRQVDILIDAPSLALGGARTRIAIDCKAWDKNVDIMEADRFAGYVEDVQPTLGVLMTTNGYSDGALARLAAIPHIDTQTVTWGDIDEWTPYIKPCIVCPTVIAAEQMPGVAFRDPITRTGALDDTSRKRMQGTGKCDKCSTIYVWCRCGTVNSFSEPESTVFTVNP